MSLSVRETREGQGVEQGAGPDPQSQLTMTIQRWNHDNHDAGMEGGTQENLNLTNASSVAAV